MCAVLCVPAPRQTKKKKNLENYICCSCRHECADFCLQHCSSYFKVISNHQTLMGRWWRSALKMFVHREEKIFEFIGKLPELWIKNFTVLIIDDLYLLPFNSANDFLWPLLGWVHFNLNLYSYTYRQLNWAPRCFPLPQFCGFTSDLVSQPGGENPPAVSWDVFNLSRHSSGIFQHWRSLCVVISIKYLQLRAAAGWREACFDGCTLQFCYCDFLLTPVLYSFNHCTVLQLYAEHDATARMTVLWLCSEPNILTWVSVSALHFLCYS